MSQPERYVRAVAGVIVGGVLIVGLSALPEVTSFLWRLR